MTPHSFVNHADARKCPCCGGNDLARVSPQNRQQGARALFCCDCNGFPMYCGIHEQPYILHTLSYDEMIQRPCKLCGGETLMPHHMALC